MKFKDALTSQEKDLFKEAIGKVKPIVQDRITPIKKQLQNKSLKEAKAKANSILTLSSKIHNKKTVKLIRKYVKR